MRIITKITKASRPKTRESQKIAYMYVFLLVIFAVSQLFSFDGFINVLADYWLPGGKSYASLLGSVIVVSEVLALPFLLGMDLSRTMRLLSMGLSWLAPLIWLILTLWLNIASNTATSVGFLGTVIDLMPGWWAVLFAVALGILAVWASWGMWPLKISKKSK